MESVLNVFEAIGIIAMIGGWMWVFAGLLFRGHCWLAGTTPEELAKTSSDIDSSTYLIISDSFTSSDSSGGGD